MNNEAENTDKALRMGKASAAGSFHLLVGVALSNVIMAVGTIILLRLISQEDYGLYSIALIPSLTMNLFRDWGVSSAMTKYLAEYKAKNEDEEVNSIIKAGLLFEAVMGAILSIITVVMSNFIASTLLHRADLSPLISLVSITTFSGALLTAIQSSFVGFEKMKYNSATMLFQAIMKTFATTLLVLIGYGALGAVLGYTLSFLAASIIAAGLLYVLVIAKHRSKTKKKIEIGKTLKMMLQYGIPLSLSSIIVGFTGQFYNFMMASSSTNLMIGNYQSAIQFSVLLSFLTVPISTVLFPAFAKLDPLKEKELLKTVYVSSVRYTAVLLVPATMAVMTLAAPMITTLFGEKWTYAPFFLSIYVAGNLFAAVGNVGMGAFLSGRGETRMLLKLSILSISIGIPLGITLIPTYGIVGVIVSNLLAGLPSMFWGLYWIWKRYEVKPDFASSGRILIASAIAVVPTYLSTYFLRTADWMKLAAGGAVFLTTYILIAPIIGAVTQSDINNLKAISSGLGAITKIVHLLLSLTARVARLRSRKEN